MKICVNTIKWLFTVLVVVFIITYAISLNIENQIVVVNSELISNNFCFAIFGGAFASLIIVLVSEIIKYFQLKKGTEDVLFSYFVSLYNHFLLIRNNCKRALNGCQDISDNMIQQTTNSAVLCLDSIYGIDYTPFCKRNRIKKIITFFKQEKYLTIKSILNDFINYRIAINTDRIDLICQEKPLKITCNSTNTNAALKKIMEQSSTLLTLVDQILTQIDNELGNRYNWQMMKQAINKAQNDFVSKSLEDYLAEDIIIL